MNRRHGHRIVPVWMPKRSRSPRCASLPRLKPPARGARCKVWLDDERKLIKPAAVIALGVTAASSLTGKTLTITKVRGKPFALADGTRLFVTIHPSSLLRIEDENDKRAAHRQFVADLKKAAGAA